MGRRRVRWTKAAYQDLKAIFDYIAADSPYHAAGVARRIVFGVRSLSRFPGQGRMVPEFDHESVRELIFGNYRVIYKVSDYFIHLLAIIHGARDLNAFWKREGRKDPRK